MMKNYRYVARDWSGARRQGVKEAAMPNDVLGWLREQKFTPISVDEVSTSDDGARREWRWRRRIKSAELAALCLQLGTMLEGGISITAALETIIEDAENLRLQQILRKVLEKIEQGANFSESISEFPNVFNRLAWAIALAGETSGNLPEALRKLADYYENRDKLAKKVKGAVAYPAFVFTIIVLVVAAIMSFIIPRFTVMFDKFGKELPAFTQAFMSFYNILRYNFVYIIGALLLIFILTVLSCTKTRRGRYLFSRVSLGMPLLGRVFSQAFVVMFCRTMSTLLSTGVSVLQTFDILSTMTNNSIIKDAIMQAKGHIVEGENVSSSMAACGFFPNMLVKMIQVGEQSGAMSKVLDRTANYYERKVDSTITTVVSMLEPLMIVTVGAIVLVVVIALYLPIFSRMV